MIAMRKIGKTFQEFDSDSSAMVVLEGDQPARRRRAQVLRRRRRQARGRHEHVEHVPDFWGDPLTAAGSQSNDGKSAYVQLYLRGNQGETRANESVAAVRDIIARHPLHPGSRPTSPEAPR